MSLSFDEVAALEVGSVVYECQYGLNVEVKVMTKPVIDETGEAKQVRFEGACSHNSDHGPTKFLLTKGFESYGPSLYAEPVYGTSEDGKLVFKILGQGEKI
jgi:hypothetical protein